MRREITQKHRGPHKVGTEANQQDGPKAGKLNRLQAWNITGANIKTTTTLSINMETKPASIPTAVTKRATLPFEAFSATAAKRSGTPDFPK